MPSCFRVVSDLNLEPAELKTPADVVRVVNPILEIRIQEILDHVRHVYQSPAVFRNFFVVDWGKELLIWPVEEQKWISHRKKFRVLDVPCGNSESHILKNARLNGDQIRVNDKHAGHLRRKNVLVEGKQLVHVALLQRLLEIIEKNRALAKNLGRLTCLIHYLYL